MWGGGSSTRQYYRSGRNGSHARRFITRIRSPINNKGVGLTSGPSNTFQCRSPFNASYQPSSPDQGHQHVPTMSRRLPNTSLPSRNTGMAPPHLEGQGHGMLNRLTMPFPVNWMAEWSRRVNILPGHWSPCHHNYRSELDTAKPVVWTTRHAR